MNNNNIDELVAATNAEMQAEERMYFCRDSATKLLAASFMHHNGVFFLSPQQAWVLAESLWNAKPEHL